VVPPAGVTYADALAIARSAHPSRVLANTAVYRYGRFTENADHTVDVHMMGSHIARFWPGTVQLWWRGHVTTSLTEALSNLVTGGYFFADGRVVCFRDYSASEAARPATDGGHHFHRSGRTTDVRVPAPRARREDPHRPPLAHPVSFGPRAALRHLGSGGPESLDRRWPGHRYGRCAGAGGQQSCPYLCAPSVVDRCHSDSVKARWRPHPRVYFHWQEAAAA
jgi:hypothetical protein